MRRSPSGRGIRLARASRRAGRRVAPFPAAVPEDAVTTVDPRPGAAARPAVPRRQAPARRRVAAYVALTKPRIIELLLVMTVPTIIFAAHGLAPIDLVVRKL